MSDAPPPPFQPGATPPPPGQQPPPPGAPPPSYPPQPGHPPQPGYPQQPGYAPQPGYPQQGFGGAPHAPVPAKKKSRWWIWVLAVLFVLALLMGGCGFLIYRAVSGPIDAANDMLEQLADGDIEEAKDRLDFDCFGNEGLDEFEAFFTANPVVSYDLTSSSNTNGAGRASGTVTLQDGEGARSAAFSLTNDDGWKVCGIDIDEP